MNRSDTAGEPARSIALTRAVSPTIIECELTHLARAPIDPVLATEQHHAYERALESLGCAVERVAPAPELPDAVFIEDTAIVLPEVAIITRPGAQSRRAETPAVAAALSSFREVRTMPAHVTLDGGDVLVIRRTIYVGASERSSAEGHAALRHMLSRFGYDVRSVRMRDCLHLKTAVTLIADDLVLHNPQWVDAMEFDGVNSLEVDPREPFASNALRVNGVVLHDRAYASTRERMERLGLRVHPIDASELAKAEGGVTCCSLIIEV